MSGCLPMARKNRQPCRPRFRAAIPWLRHSTPWPRSHRHPAFWAFGTFFICGLSTNGLIQTHFISFCSDFGMAPVNSASVLAMMGIFDFFGTIASGYLSDRYNSRWLLFWSYGLRGLSLLWLPSSTFTLFGLSIFAVFYGLDWIATVPPTVRIAAGVFGRERGGLVFGWIFMGHQLGAAVAAFGAGLCAQRIGDLSPGLLHRWLGMYRGGAAGARGKAETTRGGQRRLGDGTATDGLTSEGISLARISNEALVSRGPGTWATLRIDDADG